MEKCVMKAAQLVLVGLVSCMKMGPIYDKGVILGS